VVRPGFDRETLSAIVEVLRAVIPHGVEVFVGLDPFGAPASRVVVTTNRRRLTPAIPAFRMRRAIRLMFTRRPSTSASSARIRGAP
jgi:hypothetical protein